MVTPKATNDHFPRKTRNSPERNLFIPIAARTAGDQIMTTLPRKTRNSPDKNLFGHITAKPVDLTKIAQILCISRFQRPIPTHPQTKNLQLVKFRPTPALAHS